PWKFSLMYLATSAIGRPLKTTFVKVISGSLHSGSFQSGAVTTGRPVTGSICAGAPGFWANEEVNDTARKSSIPAEVRSLDFIVAMGFSFPVHTALAGNRENASKKLLLFQRLDEDFAD